MRTKATNWIIIFLIIISLSIIGSSDLIAKKNSNTVKKVAKTVKKKKKRRVTKFALNFQNVDIKEFLNIMSQLIGKNIIVNDRVRGKITISSAKKVPVSEAFNIMKSILEVKGYAVVESGNLIKILPIKDVIRKNAKVILNGKISKKEKTITYLLELKHAEANKIAAALKALKSKETNIVIFRPLNIIILSGLSKEINGLVKICKALDKDIEEQEVEDGIIPKNANIHVIHLENANSESLAEVLSRIPFSENAKINTSPIKKISKSSRAKKVSHRSTSSNRKKSKLSIIANKETNSLIIAATPEEFKEIKRIIDTLDIVREQVLIEALIVEVNAENGWSFGIDWMLGGQSGQHMFGGSSINGGVPNYSTPSGLSGKTLAVPASAGFQLGYLNDNSILGYALLNANGTNKNFNVLSTPQILTIDNQEAELNVAEEIPVPTNNRVSDSGTQFYTFDYKSVGVKLKITPHITKNKRITLDLYQEVNSVLGETTVMDGGSLIPPKLGKRDIKTKVSVLDSKTIVVGGLIRNNKSITEVGVPLLSEIPLLGWIFKRKTVSYTKTNLLVFITPHIVTKQEAIDKITKQKRKIQKKMQRKLKN